MRARRIAALDTDERPFDDAAAALFVRLPTPEVTRCPAAGSSAPLFALPVAAVPFRVADFFAAVFFVALFLVADLAAAAFLDDSVSADSTGAEVPFVWDFARRAGRRPSSRGLRNWPV